MPKDLKPALLLVSLFVIVIFLFGFRLGKRVEQLNKSFSMTPAPTKIMTITPADVPKNSYATYISSGCAFTFLYPDEFTQQEISSTEAQLTNKTQTIHFSCSKSNVAQAQKESTGEAKTVRINSQSVRMYEKEGIHSWIILNTLTGKRIFFETSASLTDLIIRTLEFAR